MNMKLLRNIINQSNKTMKTFKRWRSLCRC